MLLPASLWCCRTHLVPGRFLSSSMVGGKGGIKAKEGGKPTNEPRKKERTRGEMLRWSPARAVLGKGLHQTPAGKGMGSAVTHQQPVSHRGAPRSPYPSQCGNRRFPLSGAHPASPGLPRAPGTIGSASAAGSSYKGARRGCSVPASQHPALEWAGKGAEPTPRGPQRLVLTV